MSVRLTTAEVFELIRKRCEGRICSEGTLRRVMDKMENENRLEVQRLGRWRTVEFDSIPSIAEELRKTGRIQSEAVPC